MKPQTEATSRHRWVVAAIALCVAASGCGDADDSFAAPDSSMTVRCGDWSGPDDGEDCVGDARAAYSSFVSAIMAEDQLPGVAVAVVTSDDVLMTEGFGFRDLEAELPVSTDTLFHIGSTNKSMTAMAVASLVDDGLVEWETPVADLYPDLRLQDPTMSVSLRDLLSMSGGIPDDAEDDFDIDDGTAESLMDFMGGVDLLDDPGEAFSYSNISSSLAGYIGASVHTDTSDLYAAYIELLSDRVLEPIGMDAAVVRASDASLDPDYGRSYVLAGGEPEVAEPEDFDGDPFAPSGSLKANIDDMAAYVQTHLSGGTAPNGTRVITERNMAALHEPVLSGYALGWETSERAGVEFISHEGSFDNYLSVIGFVPELDLGFVVLANSADAGERLIDEAPERLIGFVVDTDRPT